MSIFWLFVALLLWFILLTFYAICFIDFITLSLYCISNGFCIIIIVSNLGNFYDILKQFNLISSYFFLYFL